ncbi:MAG: metallophosphoesterase [Candidatus Acidiferrales bacterium]
MDQKLTFVHLSDIHFILGFSSESPFDIDKPVRDAILQDAKALRSKLAPVTGVLLTGDIAYAGKSGEYTTALDWLGQLTEILGCEKEYLWCVPGNHDIDRSVLKENLAIAAVHNHLRTAADRETQLRDHLLVENTGRLLFSPLKAYSEEFATRLGCLSHPAQPWWTDDWELNDGSILRLRGLNSVLVSGPDDNDKDKKLILGAIQTDYGRESGVEYLTLCHHPTDWLLDKDRVEESLMNYSRIQLFGHKHVQKATQMDETLWLVAGAVHPERSKPDWLPRYNYLSIEVQGTGAERYMSVDVYARVWSQTERQFTREQGGYREDFRNYRLKLPEWRTPMIAESTNNAAGAEAATERGADPQRAMNMNRKKLLFRFIGLPHHTKVAIMKRFDLWQDDDQKLPDAEIFAACFERAKKKNVLDKVWEAVEGQSGRA